MPPKIGFMGGTFDPVHYGHLKSANEVLKRLGLDSVELIPCKIHPHHKRPQADEQQRLNMLELAVANDSGLSVNTLELMQDKISFTIDTLIALRSTWGEQAILHFVMGSDAFAQLHTWHRWRELLDYVNIVVLRRANDSSIETINDQAILALLDQRVEDEAQFNSASCGRLLILDTTPYAISSTILRKQIATMTEEELKAWIPGEVVHYMRREGLYGLHKI